MLVGAALAILLGLLAVWLSVTLVRGLTRIVLGTRRGRRGAPPPPVINSEPRLRLLGLAIACLLFSPLVSRLVRVTVTFLALLVERLSHNVLVTWKQQADLCALSSPAGCVEMTALALLRAAGSALGSSVPESGLARFPYGMLLFFVALWVLATELLEALVNDGEGERRRLDVKEVLLSRTYRITRQNLLFFVILFVGTYLSLASIAAIPDLSAADEGTPVAPGRSVLDKLTGLDLRVSKATGNPLQQVHAILYPVAVTDTVPRQDRNSAQATRPETAGATSAGSQVTGTQPAGAGATSSPTSGTQTTGAQTAASQTTTAQVPVTQAVVGGTGAGTTAQPVAQAQDTDSAGLNAGTIRRRLEARLAAESAPRIAVPDSQRQVVRRTYDLLAAFWADQAVRHDSLGRTLQQRHIHARHMAANAYAADSTYRVREQRSHSERLQRWLVLSTNDLQREADNATTSLQRTERRLMAWSAAAAAHLTDPSADTARLNDLVRGAREVWYDEWLAPRSAGIQQRPIPDRGGGLGVFTWVSGWLLDTDSLPLTMIVGMLGFGLLGAAASTFVREQSRREREEEDVRKRYLLEGMSYAQAAARTAAESELKPAQPLVLNLPGVVIRGGSAAIVVFLGIMGGLSVFSSEADPNPYALLFICLVGAVFSEKVWIRAERHFNLDGDSIDDQRDEGRQHGDGGRDGNGGGGPRRPESPGSGGGREGSRKEGEGT